ncbi:MAG: NAD-dependent deacylase [Candidatus Aminicenantes bacterium]|nr:NAD-dependent deacylase [Candidatus Aminicenantes bacterium]
MLDDKVKKVAEILGNQPSLTILTGAGVSAESGVPTFRGPDGLWRQFRAEDLATPEAFYRNPKLVWEWYDWRRQKIQKVKPNPAHLVIARWEKYFPSFILITQNVDGLHRQAGSTKILELHGNIWWVRCLKENKVMENRQVPLIQIPPLCSDCGSLLRPHVVWFGEALPADILEAAFNACYRSEIMMVIGTSALVQPAASLPLIAQQHGAIIVEINLEPTPLSHYADYSLYGKAGEILPLIDELIFKEKME